MNASSPRYSWLAAAFVALVVLGALGVSAGSASSLRGFVTAPKYDPHARPAQVAGSRVPEIVAGIAPSPEGRAAPRPEIIGGIASSDRVLVSDVARRYAPASQGGFNWADAGIGAATALACACLVSGFALARRKRISLAH